MALVPGTRLGNFEIAGLIGRGGMGEVYRATDTNLKRSVAIKVLPKALTADLERLARFRREAEILAALNHPHIATIYGFEHTGDSNALVMELVEGPTVADRVAKGPLPIDEALRIARQVAEAVEAAHEQGIVHRDLKPANIKVRDDGTVKVLDFGLAKAIEPPGVSAEDAAAPTITSPDVTRAGVILGTTAYMSPEQARGKPVDKRADIWAFGCVLFEMLTGRRAFDGDDVTEIVAAVVKQDPNWQLLPPGLAPGAKVLLRRCLRKSVKDRVSDIQDVRLALEGAFDAPMPAAMVVAPRSPAWRRNLPFVVTAVVVSLVTSFAAWALWPEVLPPAVDRFHLDVPLSQPFRSLNRPVFAWSPNGRALVYNAQGGLYLRQLDKFDAELVPGTEQPLSNPFFSPDGLSVGFFQDGQLKRIAIEGGATVPICRVTNHSGANWEADGTILFGQSDGIWRVSADGGTPTVVIRAIDGEQVYGPSLLPDGDSVLFTSTTTNSWEDAQIVVQSIRTGTRRVLVPRGRDAYYMRSGHLIYARENDLFGLALDRDRLAPYGGEVSLVRGVRRSSAAGTNQAPSIYAVSETGSLAYVSPRGTLQSQATWFDRRGAVLTTLGEVDSMISPELSPDDERLVVGRSTSRLDVDVWIVDGLRKVPMTFGKGQQRNSFPIWNHDGTRIGYGKSDSGGNRLGMYSVPSSGAGTEEVIVEDPKLINMTSWSRDGRFILVDRAPVDIWVIPTGGDRRPFPFIDGTPDSERDAQFSPDGRWVAYQSNESGRAEIYIRPFNEPGAPRLRSGRYPISSDGGAQPRWNHNGTELYWIAPDAWLMAAKTRLLDDTVVAEPPSRLFPARIVFGGAEMSLSSQYAVAQDGRFLINTVVVDDPSQGQTRINVVQNWLEELKQLVPTR